MRSDFRASLAKVRLSHLLFIKTKMFETTTWMEFLLGGLVVNFLGWIFVVVVVVVVVGGGGGGGGEFLFLGAAVFFGVTL